MTLPEIKAKLRKAFSCCCGDGEDKPTERAPLSPSRQNHTAPRDINGIDTTRSAAVEMRESPNVYSPVLLPRTDPRAEATHSPNHGFFRARSLSPPSSPASSMARSPTPSYGSIE